MAGVINFGTEWARAIDVAKKTSEKTLRESYQQLFTDIIKGTPVDTGRLRGNWQTTINGEPGGETGILDQDGSQAIAQVADTLGKFKLDDIVYFTNNAPYAEAIEYGHSQGQAPIGMVRVNLIGFEAIVQYFAEKNKNG